MTTQNSRPMKLMVAVDGSECSLIAAEQAGRLPWPEGTEVEILAVADAPTPPTPWAMPIPGGNFETWEKIFEDRALAQATAALARFEQLNRGRCRAAAKVARGNPKEAIIDEAERAGTDLILMGSHGYNLFERVWLGSVSRAVTAHAKSSVQVVRHKPGRDGSSMKVLLAVDGSEFGERAAMAIAARPWPEGTQLRILSAIHLPFTPTPETWALPDSYYAELEQTGRAQAQQAIDRARELVAGAATVQGTPLPVACEIVLGHPEEKILALANSWEADLIVVGSHGRSGWKRFLLGSISAAVVSHAPCSVEIVRSSANRMYTSGP